MIRHSTVPSLLPNVQSTVSDSVSWALMTAGTEIKSDTRTSLAALVSTRAELGENCARHALARLFGPVALCCARRDLREVLAGLAYVFASACGLRGIAWVG